jgi:hypothetical protein
MHVMLNALDLEEQGMWGEIVLEGKSTDLIPLISQPDHFMYPLYEQAKNRGIFYGACRSCAEKMNVSEIFESENIPLISDMSGHAAMSDFIKQGYTIITI